MNLFFAKLIGWGLIIIGGLNTFMFFRNGMESFSTLFFGVAPLVFGGLLCVAKDQGSENSNPQEDSNHQ